MNGSHGRAVRAKLSFQGENGADDRIRTGDLYFTKVLLYQLSYVGAKNQSTIPLRPVRVVKIIETSLRPLLKGESMLKKSFVIFKTSSLIISPFDPNLRFTKALLYQLSYIGAHCPPRCQEGLGFFNIKRGADQEFYAFGRGLGRMRA